MKKVLLLGGTHYQINSIKACNRLGHYSITCDYNPKNPGHKYANEYYEVSALDKEAVLKLAKKLKIDGIVCYAADTAAVTAAYVSEKMGLAGQPLKSIEILTNKDLFRPTWTTPSSSLADTRAPQTQQWSSPPKSDFYFSPLF